MNEKEIKIMKALCEKYEVNHLMLIELIDLEKEYAYKNMSRRTDISQRLNNIIDSYI